MSQKQKAKRRDSGRRQRGAEEEEEPMETQQEEQTQSTSSQINRQAQKAADNMDSTLRARKVSEMVRYLLCAEQKKVPVRRKELIDKVLMEYSRAFPVVFEKANEQLREVFGMEAREILKGKTKFYILVNCLSSSKRDGLVEWSTNDEAHTGLLSVVLSLIMMKQGQLKEDHLWVSLKRLGIDPELPHRQFGDVQRLITKEFVEQMYLNREKVAAGESYIFWYSWGPRAEQEADKRELLALVAEIHGGDLPQWERQFLDIRQPQPSPSVTD